MMMLVVKFVLALTAYNFVGAVWYSPLLFMKTFLRTTHWPKGKKREMTGGMLLTSTGCGVLQIVGLMTLQGMMRVDSVVAALKLAFVLWQFVVFPCMAVHYIFDKRPLEHLVMVVSHHLTCLLLESAILAAF